MYVELTPLRYLQAVARTGRITEAARQLRVSQPALTVALQKLEAELDTTLLLRDRRGARLTQTGEQLLHYASEALALLELAERRIAGLETEDVGRFVLGCPEALGSYFLPGFVSRQHAAMPHVELVLSSRPSRAVEAAVLAREAHFGLVTHTVAHPDLVLVELFRDAVDLMVLGSGEPLDWAQAIAALRHGPLLYVGHVPQAIEILDRLGERRLLPERQLECGHLELVKSLALAGEGVAILPRRVAEHGHPGKLRRLHPRLPFVPDVIRLAYRHDLHRTRAALRLKDAIVEHARVFSDRGGPRTSASRSSASGRKRARPR
jgi:DNA-binding transcriptional LysR family regulator